MAGNLSEGFRVAIYIEGPDVGGICQLQLVFEELREVGGGYGLVRLRPLPEDLTDRPKQSRRLIDEKFRSRPG